jgi:plastocyanin
MIQRKTNSLRLGIPSCVLVLHMLATAAGLWGQSLTVTGRVELSNDARTLKGDPSDAVVWLTPLSDLSGVYSAPGQSHLQLVQKNKSFSPHVLVVPVGAPVEFPNRDPFFHNVFSLFEGKRFDLGLYEAGSSRTVVFDRPGISYIFCNIHSEMSAVVVALRTPYYGISDRKGVISIPNVPPGRYELEVWDERALPEDLRALTRNLEISETFHSLGVVQLAEHRSVLQSHKNKYGQDYENPTPNLPGYVHP